MKLLLLTFSLLTFIMHAETDSMHFNDNNFFVGVEYLFWKGESDQLQFALDIPGGVPQGGLAFAKKTIIESQRFKYDSGVRASAGIFLCNNFDTRLVYTNFNTNPCTFISGDPLSIVATPIFGLLDFGGAVGDAARSTWCLRFKTLDWEIGNTCCLCDVIELRPHIGLKVAKIKQAQEITYFGIPNGVNARVLRTNEFSAVGPRIGVDEKLAINDCFNLIARVSGALVFGKFDVSKQFFISQGDISLEPLFVQCKKQVRPTIQILGGFSFERLICNTLVEIGAAYEAQYWWNQWQLFPSAAALPAGVASLAGDLMLSGLTISASIRF